MRVSSDFELTFDCRGLGSELAEWVPEEVQSRGSSEDTYDLRGTFRCGGAD